MGDRAAEVTSPGDSQTGGVPRLPGTSMPAREVAAARLHLSAGAIADAVRAGELREWVLEFEPSSPPEIAPLMGWTASSDPFGQIRLRFPDRQSAIEFAERQGWRYVVRDAGATLFAEELRRPLPLQPGGCDRTCAGGLGRRGADHRPSRNARRKIGLSGAFPAHPRA